MNELRLKSGVQFAPSGMAFTDPVTGFKVCPYERGIAGAVQILIDHRRANPAKYDQKAFEHFSPALVKQELLRHLFEKAPHLFKGEPMPMVTRTDAGFPKACTQCVGTEFDQTECPTCSGHRINGYRCKQCGKSYGL